MTIISSFFVMISYQIITLNYYQTYLRFFMLKNGTRENIYDNWKLVFRHDKLHNYNIIPT